MFIGEICNRDVIYVREQDSLEDAVKLMRIHHVGDVVVVREKDSNLVPVGILTDRDVLIRVLGQNLSLDDFDVGDVMSQDLMTGRESETLADAMKRMRGHGVRRLPVVNSGGGLVGILTVDDIVDLLAEELSELALLIRNEQTREVTRTVNTSAQKV